MNRQQAINGPGKNVSGAGVLKLPVVNHCVSRRVRDIVRKAKLGANVVLSSGPSLICWCHLQVVGHYAQGKSSEKKSRSRWPGHVNVELLIPV